MQREPIPFTRVLAAAVLSACLSVVSGSAHGIGPGRTPLAPEFQYVRLRYQNHPRYAALAAAMGNYQWWTTDLPDADPNLMRGMKRLTRINLGDNSKRLSVLDDQLFNYPFAYAVEVGHWYLSDAQAQRLREYLLRGGTLLVDDFHGSIEWGVFMQSMRRVFPDRPVVDIKDSDPIMHVLYDLDERTQIAGLGPVLQGKTYEFDGYKPHWRGVYDDTGRLMVIINFNMDMGDSWEEADNHAYPEALTALGYRYAVNYFIYAMTH